VVQREKTKIKIKFKPKILELKGLTIFGTQSMADRNVKDSEIGREVV
jgi:hypothetical protein